MRAKRDWERVRSPHARFLEGLQAAIAAHPSASGRGGANRDDRLTVGARLTVVGGATDNVIQMPIGRTPQRRRLRAKDAPDRGGSPAA
jgi:hypothetical protein